MGREIERKYLLAGEFVEFATGVCLIRQGYLSSVPGRTVRVRLKDDRGFLTIKGPPSNNGLSRFEWEKEIEPGEASELLVLCEPGIIEKTRYYVPWGDFTIEVDVFRGENEGLVMAEVELESETDNFEKPGWLGEEVTGDRRYYNSYLKDNPYKTWNARK